MDTTNPHLAPTTEVMGAFLLNRADESAVKQFRTDPKAALVSSLNLDVGDSLDINCVENNANTVHLILPYYDSIDMAKAEKMSDMNLEEVAGGEIIISTIIGAIVGGVIGSVLGTTIGGSAAVGAVIGAVAGTVALGAAVGIAVPASGHTTQSAYDRGMAAGDAEAAGTPVQRRK